MVVELNIIPLGKGVSVSQWLVPALKALEERKVKFYVTPMCTIFEATSVEDAFTLARFAHEASVRAGAERVVTTVKIDDRHDIEQSMDAKVEALKKGLSKTE